MAPGCLIHFFFGFNYLSIVAATGFFKFELCSQFIKDSSGNLKSTGSEQVHTKYKSEKKFVAHITHTPGFYLGFFLIFFKGGGEYWYGLSKSA